MTNLRKFFGLLLVSTLFFTACKKETLTTNNTDDTSKSQTTNVTIDQATQTRALAAAASVANSRNGGDPDTTFNECGCYDLFDGIDFDASHEEIEAAIETALEGLSETEIDRLFEPVCTEDGEIYESACIADCEEITDYHVCSDEELGDYFFGDFDCENLDNLTFPTEIELPDGTIVTVNSEEELWETLDKWFEEYGDDFEDEEWEEDYFEDCFTVIYPIQVQFPSGEVLSYNSEEELYAGIDGWYEQNPDSMEDPMPVYPFDVLLPDSTTATISNEMEEDALWEECYGDFDFELCFELVYPINLVYPDASTLAVNNEAELEKAIDDYYEANPDSEEDINVQYPIQITLSDGISQTINNEEELEAAIEACFDFENTGRIIKESKKSMLSAKRVVKGAFLRGK